MFGTLGFSELIIILVIVLIIFGAGRLPQIGEGVGKALKGFKKEVHEMPPPVEEENPTALGESQAPVVTTSPVAPTEGSHQTATPPSQQPYKPGPEMTPGTLAAQVYGGVGPEIVQPAQEVSNPPNVAQEAANTTHSQPSQPPRMEQHTASTVPRPASQYPPVPPSAISKPGAKRPSAIVNKAAVTRVQAQRAAMQQKAAQSQGAGSAENLQSLGEGLGSALRTFREASNDVRSSIDPEMRTIQAELDAAQKEIEQTMEVAKQPPLPKESPPKT